MGRVLSTLSVVVPLGRRKEALDLLKFLTGPLRYQPRCRSCRAYQCVDNPNKLTLVEEWESRENLEQYIRSHDYRQVLALIDLSAEAPKIRFDTISKTEGMELIEAVRAKDSRL
jgi:quinol monooxygenase YgiN